MTFTLLLLAISALGSALIVTANRELHATDCRMCGSVVRVGDVLLRAYRKDFDNTIVCLECEQGRGSFARGGLIRPEPAQVPPKPAAETQHFHFSGTARVDEKTVKAVTDALKRQRERNAQ